MTILNSPYLLCFLFLFPISQAAAEVPILNEDTVMLLADVSIHDKNDEKFNHGFKTKTSPRVIPHKVGQYEIEGYMDKEYVRVVLEVEKKGRIVGNIYDKAGKGIYVHGEYQEGALYVYDDEGTEYTIVVE